MRTRAGLSLCILLCCTHGGCPSNSGDAVAESFRAASFEYSSVSVIYASTYCWARYSATALRPSRLSPNSSGQTRWEIEVRECSAISTSSTAAWC
jgi:hypothetical protein